MSGRRQWSLSLLHSIHSGARAILGSFAGTTHDELSDIGNSSSRTAKHVAHFEEMLKECDEGDLLFLIDNHKGRLAHYHSLKTESLAQAQHLEARAQEGLTYQQRATARLNAAHRYRLHAEDHGPRLKVLELELLAIRRALAKKQDSAAGAAAAAGLSAATPSVAAAAAPPTSAHPAPPPPSDHPAPPSAPAPCALEGGQEAEVMLLEGGQGSGESSPLVCLVLPALSNPTCVHVCLS